MATSAAFAPVGVRAFDARDGADLGVEIDVRIVDSTADAPDTGGVPPLSDAAFEGWTADIPDWCTCEETDLNGDGTVSTVDFGQFLACFGKDATGSCLVADFNGDGVVGNIDFQCFKARLGQVCS